MVTRAYYDTQTGDLCFAFNQKRGFYYLKKIEFLQLAISFGQDFVDPAQMFGYVNVDVGDIWVFTVFLIVE